MHQIDNCLESTGGDILEMSCTTIVSIPLVLGCMKAVSVSRRNRQGGPHGGAGEEGIYYGSHQQDSIAGGAMVVQRVVIISVIYLKSNSGGDQSLKSTGQLAFCRCLLFGKVPC